MHTDISGGRSDSFNMQLGLEVLIKGRVQALNKQIRKRVKLINRTRVTPRTAGPLLNTLGDTAEETSR